MAITLILGLLLAGVLLGAADRAWTRRRFDSRLRPWRRSLLWRLRMWWRKWLAGLRDAQYRGGWR